MSLLNISIQQPIAGNRNIIVKMNADKFEKFAASLGFFSDQFLKSLNRSERDYKAGRFNKIKSFKELRK